MNDNERNWAQGAALALRLVVADDNCKLSPEAEKTIREMNETRPESLDENIHPELVLLSMVVKVIEKAVE